MGYTIRTKRYRYTEWYPFKTDSIIPHELYDHQNDPEETVNIEEQSGKPLIDSLHRKLRSLVVKR